MILRIFPVEISFAPVPSPGSFCPAKMPFESSLSILFAGCRLGYIAAADAAGAYAKGAHGAIGELMPHRLEIWRKAPFCLNVGMADKVANLGPFATKSAFFAHLKPAFVKEI